MFNAGSILSGTQGGLFGLGGYFGPGFNIANALYEGQAPVMQAAFSAQAAQGKGPFGGESPLLKGMLPALSLSGTSEGKLAKPTEARKFMPIGEMRAMLGNAWKMNRPDDTPSLYRFNKLFEQPEPTTPVGTHKKNGGLFGLPFNYDNTRK